jgi:hypothetical protein
MGTYILQKRHSSLVVERCNKIIKSEAGEIVIASESIHLSRKKNELHLSPPPMLCRKTTDKKITETGV